VIAHVQERLVIEESTDPRERLGREITRVHDRLRSMSTERLALPIPGHQSRAVAAHVAARRLSLLAQGIEQRADAHPSYRELPVINAVVAQQVAVCGQDVLMAIAGVADDEPVWVGLERSHVRAAVLEAVDALSALRLAL
jgi:hypothetical protein